MIDLDDGSAEWIGIRFLAQNAVEAEMIGAQLSLLMVLHRRKRCYAEQELTPFNILTWMAPLPFANLTAILCELLDSLSTV